MSDRIVSDIPSSQSTSSSKTREALSLQFFCTRQTSECREERERERVCVREREREKINNAQDWDKILQSWHASSGVQFSLSLSALSLFLLAVSLSCTRTFSLCSSTFLLFFENEAYSKALFILQQL